MRRLLLLVTTAAALEASEGLSLLQTRSDRLSARSSAGAGSDAAALDGGLPEIFADFFGSAAAAAEEGDENVTGQLNMSSVDFAARAAEETIADLGTAEKSVVARLSATVDDVKQVGRQIGGELAFAEREVAARLARVQAGLGREEVDETKVLVSKSNVSQEQVLQSAKEKEKKQSVPKKEKEQSAKARDLEDFERLDIEVTTMPARDEVIETAKSVDGKRPHVPKKTEDVEPGTVANIAYNASSDAASDAQRWLPDALEEAS